MNFYSILAAALIFSCSTSLNKQSQEAAVLKAATAFMAAKIGAPIVLDCTPVMPDEHQVDAFLPPVSNDDRIALRSTNRRNFADTCSPTRGGQRIAASRPAFSSDERRAVIFVGRIFAGGSVDTRTVDDARVLVLSVVGGQWKVVEQHGFRVD